MVDLKDERLPGFDLHEFDLRPSILSKDGLWLLQTDQPIPEESIFSGNHFAKPIDFLSKKHPTRLLAHYWPNRWDPTVFDGQASKRGWLPGMDLEPNGENWGQFRLLAGQMRLPRPTRRCDWLIYWPMIGHSGSGWRIEGPGIVPNINQTLSRWFDMLRTTILPVLPPDCPVMVHPDHSTARLSPDGTIVDRPAEGFLFTRNVNLPAKVGWAEVREAGKKCLES